MPGTRVLIVYGTKGDFSDGLARQLALALRCEGVEAEAYQADQVPDLEDYDGVALEGAREGAGWTLFAREFTRRHASELRMLPAWFLPSTHGPSNVTVREQTWWAHAIARGLGGPSTPLRPFAWPGTLNPVAQPLPN
jgi:menaquinone-dependent protoporphyrinogen IX oxidase